MMDYKGLIAALRCTNDETITCKTCKYSRYDKYYKHNVCDVHQLQRDAATAIETLTAEIERVTEERDAAIADLKSACEDSGDACHICKHLPCKETHGHCIGWEWRGRPLKGDHDGTID